MRHLKYMSLDSLFFEDGTSPEGIEDGVGIVLRADLIPAEVFCLPYLGFATSLVVFARYNNFKLKLVRIKFPRSIFVRLVRLVII